MSTAPTWQAPTSGQPPLASHVNQLLGAHACNVIYNGTQTSGQLTSGGTTVSTNGLWLAQSFTTAAAQTTIGHLSLSLTTTTTSGASLAPTTVSIQANNAGAPSNTPLVSVTIPAEYANIGSGGVTTTRINIPTYVTGLTPSSTYWIVVAAAGNVSNSYTVHQSNQVSGASTSTNGTTWTAQAYGFTYAVRDNTVSGVPLGTLEDAGARWTFALYDASQRVTAYYEYTAGQTTSGYLSSNRTYVYSGWLPTIIS
jgi:hypothetical protein